MRYTVIDIINAIAQYWALWACGLLGGGMIAGWRRLSNRQTAVELGIQALLRSQMIADYNKWMDRGYAPIYAKESFENCWKQYHALGVNGVMDNLHEQFLELPTSPNQA